MCTIHIALTLVLFQIGDNKGEEDEVVPVELPEAVTESLCANFDLVDEVIRTDPGAASEILKVLLDSIGRLDLNALSQEPTVCAVWPRCFLSKKCKDDP